ncbi:related to GPI mannosyltransferase 1 [Saccharomycodes ludwigii]|uniref:GPI mannosyltransferase 1 n=1 Tax=Saccharomycodes ludwigii TaxID=36035 RepID=A0A376BBX5_9ASCO|nr:hypothetical protein SCDLUD_004452 [Saccharomycodes ludwigii]KAH3899030.1 hypothetical protein SCDLUD_004452 [Saccharomycodes ludwigii]SSD62198.1 related to GPI mannosyltransferase 1 [Saccharomycodes ludwigii]
MTLTEIITRSPIFTKWSVVLTISLLLRLIFFLYGIYQDTYFQVKYTDIDYYVFHDASRYVYNGNQSPYLRDTYRYTPLLSWLLLPNHIFQWIHMGKFIFLIFDLLTGVFIHSILTNTNKSIRKQNFLWSTLWLYNPMVITISTRGNAESVLCFIIMLCFYLLQKQHYILGGIAYGLSIHFKIYPIIYCIPMFYYYGFITKNFKISKRILILFKIAISSISTILALNYLMYKIYGYEFIYHSYLYHLIRTDHRHNFSIWNLLLYLESSMSSNNISNGYYKFLPQLIISFVAIPTLILSSIHDFIGLLNVLFIQTYAFVIFNKVITSQYFIWYLLFLPLYLSNINDNNNNNGRGKAKVLHIFKILLIWVSTQAIWLYFAYYLEFQGLNCFYPWLFIGHLWFFIGNVYILGKLIDGLIISELNYSICCANIDENKKTQ